MKKGILVGILALVAVTAQAQTTVDRGQVFTAIAAEEDLNGYDIDEMRQFTNTASESELKNYLASVIYMKDCLKDAPNEMDKQDLKSFIERRSLVELVELVNNKDL